MPPLLFPRAIRFGIGTRLTCDIPQVKPLNIVIKLVECNGKPGGETLSDSPGKTTATIKRLFGRCAKRSTFRILKKPVNIIRELIGSLFLPLIPKSFAAFANSACLIADAR
ncbi:hypothetical protein ACNKHL_05480 [Shigella flexneri]